MYVRSKTYKRVRERARSDYVKVSWWLECSFDQKRRISLIQIESLLARILAETLDTSDIFSIVVRLA